MAESGPTPQAPQVKPAVSHGGSSIHVLSNAELMQQVIYEDFKRIVQDMRSFRIEHYDQQLATQNNKCLLGAKGALSRRWVVFYQNMLNLDIFSFETGEAPNGEP